MKSIWRAIVGLLLVFVVHLPRLLWTALLLSYAAVFTNRPTLTASPAEHIKRARKILRRGRLSELLYAAIELRFALERMAQRELIFADMASNRMLKEHDPAKKLANLHRLAPQSAFNHKIYFVNKNTGERLDWAEYRPMDKVKVAEMKGRLGDILHPKDNLRLGVPNDPWYKETIRFLTDSLDYLSIMCKDNSIFFAYEGLEQFEMVRNE